MNPFVKNGVVLLKIGMIPERDPVYSFKKILINFFKSLNSFLCEMMKFASWQKVQYCFLSENEIKKYFDVHGFVIIFVYQLMHCIIDTFDIEFRLMSVENDMLQKY